MSLGEVSLDEASLDEASLGLGAVTLFLIMAKHPQREY